MPSPNTADKRGLSVRRILALAMLAVVIATGCRASGPLVGLEGRDGKQVQVTVEIVSTPETQRKGLMWRTELPSDHGMLFVFADDTERSFWMKNTPLPLDILFIGSDLRIVSIAENTVPYSLASIPSAGPAKYVLEVNAGFSRKHGVAAGSRVSLPELTAHDDG